MAEENKIILDADVKPLKKQLREATQELQVARQKFGEFSDEAVNAAQKVAGIRDSIEDANEAAQLFDPGKRFQALTTAASTAAGGIAAVQGAMALFGSESEDVEKALLKVQSAMALSQGLSQLKDIGKVGDQLKLSFQGLTAGANGFKKALISTGIGALVVAVGLLVAYWDDILGLVSGVSSEQKKLNEQIQKNLDASLAELDTIESQNNQLKLQGKTEQEILDIKIARTKETILEAEAALASANITKEAQIEAAKRNKDILKGIILFLNLPITGLLKTVDVVATLLQKAGVISEATALSSKGLADQVNDTIAKTLFDPEEVAAEGDKAIKETENTLNSLKEKRDGYELLKIDLQKQAGEKASAEREKQAKLEEDALAILEEAKNKMKSEEEQARLAIEKSYQEKSLKLKEAGIEDDGNLAKAKQNELDAIDEKYNKEKAEKEEEFQKELNEILTQTRLDGIRDENEKAREQIILDFEKRRQETLDNEKYTADQKTTLALELATQEQQALAALQQSIDEQNLTKELEALDKQMQDAEMDFKLQRDLLDQKQMLLEEYYSDGREKDEEYTKAIEANTDARIELDKKEAAAKLENAARISGLLSGISDLVGKNTAAGKATAIAATTIDTYLGAQKAYTSQLIPGDPSSPIRAALAAALAVAGGIKNVRAIAKTQVPGGGGGASAPSVSASAPQTASAVPTIGTSPVTALGQVMQNQPPLRAYVVESEVTGTQKRVADIERRAGF